MSAEVFRQTIKEPSYRVIVALDNMTWEQADTVMGEVGPYVGLGKANSIAQRRGWEHAIDKISTFGAYTMADPKYKDIPETMKNHLREITQCLPRLVTVHADNTPESLEYAVEGRNEAKAELQRTEWGHEMGLLGLRGIGGILGITVLTSINTEQCVSIYGDEPEAKVLQFAETALEAGLDGIVCSGKELTAIRSKSKFDKLLTVVPGITPAWAKKAEDQKRVVTPAEALREGADYIVVGRAITKPPEGVSRAEAAQRIEQELKEAA